MKPIAMALVAAGLALSACGPSATSGLGPGSTTPVANDSFRGMMNTARQARSLAPLSREPRLAQAAQGHADDMSINGYFSHTSQDGRTLGDRVRATGYRYCWAGENIARGQTSQAAVFSAWMNSSGHRANILSSNAREFGLGRAPGNYWVLVLAQPGC